MADDNQLIISISAETIELVRGLATGTNGLQDFAKEGKTTAATITSALSAINKEAKNTFDVTALGNFNRSTKELKGTLTEIRNIGVGPAIKDVGDQSKNARVALYGLNQVVRDLPFGFIAISNNIPVALDQFQNLIKQSGGVGNAFKNLGKAMIGAGGLSLAFSAVTSLITSAIQKYGSLGVAINTVLNLIDAATLANIKLTDAIDAANASSDTEVSKVRQLVTVLGNVQEPLNKRNNAYATLAKEYPGIIQDITNENALTNDGISAIRNRSNELVKYILLKGQEKALTDLVTETTKNSLKAQRDLIRTITGEGKTLVDDILAIAESWYSGAPPIVNQLKEVGKLNEETKAYANTLEKTRNALLDLDFAITGQGGEKQLTEQQRKAKEIAEAAAEQKVQDKIRTFELSRQKKILENQLRYLAPETQEYEKILDRIQIINGELKKIGETDARIIAQIDIDVKFNREQVKKEIQDTIQKTGGVDVLQREFGAVKLELPVEILPKKERLETGKLVTADFIEKFNTKLATTPLKIPVAITNKEKELSNLIKSFRKTNKQITEEQTRQLAEIGDLVYNILGDGIRVFQEGIKEGVDGTKALKAALREVGKELTKIIIKLAAIEVIKLIATLTTGDPKSGKAVGDILSKVLNVPNINLGGKRGSAPTRGLDVGPGGLALAGQVTFVQRGPDLVGVLAQANNRINRVG